MSIEVPEFPRTPPRARVFILFGSLWAFILREFKSRYGTSRLGYFWAIADPVFNVGLLLLIRGGIRHIGEIYGQSAVVFFAVGVVPYFAFQHSLGAATNAINSSRGLFNYRQIRPIDIIIARSLIEAGLMALTLLVIWLGCPFFGIAFDIDNGLELVGAMIMLALLGTALGLCFEVYGTVFPEMRRVFSLFTRPLYFLSGLFYTIGMLPQKYQPFVTWNPVLHLVDFARESSLPNYHSPASWTYAMACIAVLFFIGLSAYRRYIHHLL